MNCTILLHSATGNTRLVARFAARRLKQVLILLVVGASLLLLARSYGHLAGLEPGFQPEGVHGCRERFAADLAPEVYEPYLVQQGLLARTPRGRVASSQASGPRPRRPSARRCPWRRPASHRGSNTG